MKYLLRALFLSLVSTSVLATVHQVNSGNLYYSPSELTIHVGDTVVWINDGGTHNVNGNVNSITGNSFNNPESFDSPSTNIVGATIYTHVFNLEGTYNYDCSVASHALQGMTGTINVVNSTTVVDIIVNSENHGILETAVIQAGLAETLSGDGPFTVFAPSDDAFDGLPAGALDLILANAEQLTDLLLNHVHSGNVFSTDLENGMGIPTLNDTELTVTIDGMSVMIDLASVTQPDLIASNGIVHVIDKVLLPDFGQEDTTIYSIIKASPIHTTLESAIDAAELGETLSGDGPFTVFAPTDDAFDALPAGALDDLLANISLLTEILLHHVHSGNVLSTDLSDGMEVPTMNDDVLVVSIDAGSVMIDMSTVIQPDIVANNGVVHIIDAVLMVEGEPTSINTFLNQKDLEYLYTINLLGELVDRDSKENILVDIYSNGTSIKRYNLRK
ncbi:fasciclin domain-containing protein [Flavobacteriales bacterium]|nr:fasciclin domain-containing protein [Flavobacteriales bacterium]